MLEHAECGGRRCGWADSLGGPANGAGCAAAHLVQGMKGPQRPGTGDINSVTTRAKGAPFTFAPSVPYWNRETSPPYTCGHSPRGIFCNDTRELCRVGR